MPPPGRLVRFCMNKLSQEISPYLLQHAENPVDWQPWGPEALERARAEAEADLPLRWIFGLPLVPRDGPRELREPRDCGTLEPRIHLHQGRSRRAAGSGPDLHGRRAGDDWPGRLADVGLPHARAEAVLRRHLLAAARPGRDAGLPRGDLGRGRRLARIAATTSSSRPKKRCSFSRPSASRATSRPS